MDTRVLFTVVMSQVITHHHHYIPKAALNDYIRTNCGSNTVYLEVDLLWHDKGGRRSGYYWI